MRRVVKEIKSQEVEINSTNVTEKYYGTQLGCMKYLLTCDYRMLRVSAANNCRFMTEEYVDVDNQGSTASLINNLYERHEGLQIYEFDTRKELFDWLLEN